jgi:hypothetical protein
VYFSLFSPSARAGIAAHSRSALGVVPSDLGTQPRRCNRLSGKSANAGITAVSHCATRASTYSCATHSYPLVVTACRARTLACLYTACRACTLACLYTACRACTLAHVTRTKPRRDPNVLEAHRRAAYTAHTVSSSAQLSHAIEQWWKPSKAVRRAQTPRLKNLKLRAVRRRRAQTPLSACAYYSFGFK